MKIAIFDTETTGLLKPSPAPLEQQPEIIEFYSCVIDEDFNLIRELETLIKPSIPKLPDIIPKITGITDDMLIGQPSFLDVYPDLARFMTGVDMIVAHNLEFDAQMMANELLRIGKLIQFPWPRHHVCTVVKSIGVRGHRLKLSDLYEEATGKEFKDAHRAKQDVRGLFAGFRFLVQKGYVNFKDYQ